MDTNLDPLFKIRVDTSNYHQQSNSRIQRMRQSKPMNIAVVFLSSFLFVESAILGEWDDLNRDAYEPNRGVECDNGTEIKWYVDNYREKVYPFLYLGCEGDENMYDDVPTAEKNLPTDSGQCVGFNMTGWPEYGEEGEDPKCPEGSSYLAYGEHSAICCDDDTAERYEASRLVMCANGEPPLTHEVIYMEKEKDELEETEVSRENRTLFGKLCSHNFCPEMYECIQGEFDAHCCLVPTTVVPTTVFTTEADVSTTIGVGPELASPSSLVGVVPTRTLLILGSAVAVCLIVCIFAVVLCKSRRNRSLSTDKMTEEKERMHLNP